MHAYISVPAIMVMLVVVPDYANALRIGGATLSRSTFKCDIAPDRIPKYIPTLPLNRINGRFYRRDQGGQMAG